MPENSELLSTTEAAAMLGMGEELFEDTVEDHPWLRHVWLGKGKRKIKRWPADGIRALAYVLKHLSSPENQPLKGAEGG